MNQQQRSCGRFYSSKQPAVGMDGDATFMEVRGAHEYSHGRVSPLDRVLSGAYKIRQGSDGSVCV